jgi:hypothetical protein
MAALNGTTAEFRLYNAHMRRLTACFILLAAAATAQDSPAVSGLTATLMTLHDSHVSRDDVNRRFVAGVMATVVKPSRPFQSEVEDFTSELTAAIVGRRFTSSDLLPMTSAIVDVMHSGGVSTLAFRASVERFQKGLAALGVVGARLDSITNRLQALGQEVRGPEDAPVRLDFK